MTCGTVPQFFLRWRIHSIFFCLIFSRICCRSHYLLSTFDLSEAHGCLSVLCWTSSHHNNLPVVMLRTSLRSAFVSVTKRVIHVYWRLYNAARFRSFFVDINRVPFLFDYILPACGKFVSANRKDFCWQRFKFQSNVPLFASIFQHTLKCFANSEAE